MTAAAQLLRDARLRAGLSQTELARRARISQPVISAYENGRREPGHDALVRLLAETGHTLALAPLVDPTPKGLPLTSAGRRLHRARRRIIELAGRRGATNVRVFGSVARGDDTSESDIDLLVDIGDDVSLLDLIGLERELTEILRRPVDVVPARNLKPAVARRALADAIPL